MANQRQAAIDYAVRLGLTNIVVYSETASGGKEDRAGFGLMMKELRRGDTVIFPSLSRMTRSGVYAALEILRQLEACGAFWHFTEQPILNYDSKTDKVVKSIMLAVLSSLDEDYRRRISERTKAKLAQLKLAGVKLGGARPGAGRPRKNQRSPSSLVKREEVTIIGAMNSEPRPKGGGQP